MKSDRPPVALIIPAMNEESRIGRTLDAACRATLPTEIIVVSDGSHDRTAEVASRYEGVAVIKLKRNLGKGGAMAAGVNSTKAPIIAFFDADLEGLQPHHIDAVIRPVLDGQAQQCVGILRGGKPATEFAMRVSPGLSGQRAMRREVFEIVPFIHEVRFGVEVVLNNSARMRGIKIKRVLLHGVSNSHKEQKLGLAKGMTARMKMYAEIGQAMVKVRKRPDRRTWRRPPF